MTVLKLIVHFRKNVGMTFFDSNRIITARFWFESLLKPQIRNEIKDFKFFFTRLFNVPGHICFVLQSGT